MTITLSASELAWVNLPSEQKEVFNNIAYKDGNPDLDGYDWFEHLVPTDIQDQPEMVDAFMDGGTVTQEVWVHDQGTANGHYEQIQIDVADKDVSRITSGANGGEYTLDNTVMEDASLNRARGAADMTSTELESIDAANAAEAGLIDGGEIVESTVEVTSGAIEATEVGTQILGATVDVLSDVVAPAVGAYIAGTAVAEHCDNQQEAVVYGGLTAIGVGILCTTPVGATVLGMYCGAKLFKRVWTACGLDDTTPVC